MWSVGNCDVSFVEVNIQAYIFSMIKALLGQTARLFTHRLPVQLASSIFVTPRYSFSHANYQGILDKMLQVKEVESYEGYLS